MSIGLHHRAADVASRLAFEEATFNNIGADEINTRAEQPRQQACLFAALVVRLRAQFGKVEQLLAECLGCIPGVMEQVAAQQGLLWFALELQPFVDDAFPLGEAAPPDADFGLGIEAAALDPLSAIVVEAVHGKDLVVGDFLVFEFGDGLLQFVGEGLIGVDGEDEVAGGEVVGEVLLVGVAEPVLREEFHAVAVADGLSRIGGMAVHDDNLVGDILHRVKALSNLLFLVEGDDDDRKRLHGSNFPQN